MSKNNGLKRVICSTLIVAFLLSFMSLNVFAEDTKVVTVSTPGSITATLNGVNVDSLRNQYRNYTYNYDDGTYIGKLNFSDITNITLNRSIPTPGSSATYYLYTFNIIYSGTVTMKTTTKYVTVTRDIGVTATLNGLSIDYLRGQYGNTTFDYDDGTYRGKLAFSDIIGIKETGKVPTSSYNGAADGAAIDALWGSLSGGSSGDGWLVRPIYGQAPVGGGYAAYYIYTVTVKYAGTVTKYTP